MLPQTSVTVIPRKLRDSIHSGRHVAGTGIAEGSLVGIGIQVAGLTSPSGPQRIWKKRPRWSSGREVSVLLGPSVTRFKKSQFLKSLIACLYHERAKTSSTGPTSHRVLGPRKLLQIRTLFV